MKTPYEVHIFAPDDHLKDWYVYLYSDNRIQKKFYKGLNKITTYNERLQQAIIIKNHIEKEFHIGWRNFVPPHL